jgi:hypothetical protein
VEQRGQEHALQVGELQHAHHAGQVLVDRARHHALAHHLVARGEVGLEHRLGKAAAHEVVREHRVEHAVVQDVVHRVGVVGQTRVEQVERRRAELRHSAQRAELVEAERRELHGVELRLFQAGRDGHRGDEPRVRPRLDQLDESLRPVRNGLQPVQEQLGPALGLGETHDAVDQKTQRHQPQDRMVERNIGDIARSLRRPQARVDETQKRRRLAAAPRTGEERRPFRLAQEPIARPLLRVPCALGQRTGDPPGVLGAQDLVQFGLAQDHGTFVAKKSYRPTATYRRCSA